MLAMVLPIALTPVLRADTYIASLVSETSYTSYHGSLFTDNGSNRGLSGADHDPARDFIYNTFTSFGLNPCLDGFSYGGKTYYNVVGVLPCTTEADEVYVVGAHYDSANNPGADDDASGVAGVLETARVLSQFRFASTIVFAAFDREEQGLYGSWAYANAHSHDNIQGMISLDMIAWQSAAHPNTAFIYGGTAPASTDFDIALQIAFQTYGGGITATRMGANSNSDNYPFEKNGKAGALLIEGYPSSNPCYHKGCDSTDTGDYIDYDYATSMTRVTVGFLSDSATAVPEPATAVLAGVGLLAVFGIRRRWVHGIRTS